MHACMYVRMYVCMYVCMHVRMYALKNVCIYVCMYVCMHACLHVCMYVRMSCLSTYFRWPRNTTLKNRTIYFRWPRNTTLKSKKHIFEPQDNSFDAVFGSLCLCAARLPGRFGPIQLSHHEARFLRRNQHMVFLAFAGVRSHGLLRGFEHFRALNNWSAGLPRSGSRMPSPLCFPCAQDPLGNPLICRLPRP